MRTATLIRALNETDGFPSGNVRLYKLSPSYAGVEHAIVYVKTEEDCTYIFSSTASGIMTSTEPFCVYHDTSWTLALDYLGYEVGSSYDDDHVPGCTYIPDSGPHWG